MKKPLLLFLALCLFSCASPNLNDQPSVPPEELVSAVLDDLHDAASDADYDRYFGHFSSRAVFIGTDAWERWPLKEFQGYTKARFDQGTGWAYAVTSRHLFFSGNHRTAWFDEMLQNENLGECRGTGVLIWENEEWKVAQYHLAIPIPNDLAYEFVSKIRQIKTNQ